jgi:hypothetical protein
VGEGGVIEMVNATKWTSSGIRLNGNKLHLAFYSGLSSSK